MTQKVSKQEAKAPDALLVRLQNILKYGQSHSQIFVLGFAGLILITLGIGIFGYVKERNELSLQEKYFQIEKTYLDKKEKFEETSQKIIELEKALSDKTKPANKVSKSKKDNKAAANESSELADNQKKMKDLENLKKDKETGDLEKDYGKVVEDFRSFIKENAGSKSALMATLSLFEMAVKYKKYEITTEVFKAIENKISPKDLMGGLVLNQYASILANQNNCQNAVDIWKSIVTATKTSILNNEVKLRMGLCYEKLGQSQSAEQVYTEITKSAVGEKEVSGSQKDAEKFLRLLKIKNANL